MIMTVAFVVVTLVMVGLNYKAHAGRNQGDHNGKLDHNYAGIDMLLLLY